jgi:tryptophan 2,3-dioxygenase
VTDIDPTAPTPRDPSRPPPPSFGEEDRRLSYGSYLQLERILSSQVLESSPPAHDELLFIVIHQVYELWFKQLVFELETVRAKLFEGDAPRVRHLLERVHAIERVLIEQVAVLETMSPQDFLEFRTHLAPASGFQSVQFREVEFLSGLKDEQYLDRLVMTPQELERLRRRLDEPSIWDAFCAYLENLGLPMPREDAEARRASLVEVARNRERFGESFAVAEYLLTHDEFFALWRYRHVLMVERQIGSKTGTGGSTGASYLKTTLDKRFYPELWELRSFI